MGHKTEGPTPDVLPEETIESFSGVMALRVEGEREGIVYDVTLGGNGELVAFSVWRRNPDAAQLTGRMFRDIRVETVAMRIRRELEKAKGTKSGPWGNPLKAALQLLDPTDAIDSSDQRRGRPSRSDLEVAQIADRYTNLVIQLGGNGAAAQLAAELSLSKSTVLGILNEARSGRRGLLSKAPKGRSGGQLTQKARRLLEKGS